MRFPVFQQHLCAAVFALVGLIGGSCAQAASPAPYRDCPVCPEMVHVPGGSFRMGDARGDGDPNELPVHTVRVRAFSMGRFDVTYDEWNLCMKDGVCDEVYLAPYEESFGRGRRPVVNVTWGQARRFIGWLSKKSGKPYRLPTEAEWEYAARAGATTPYPSGNELAPGIANCYSECGEDYDLTAPVGSFKPNAFGLYDTVGNVWQWVQDCWADSYKGAPTNGSARTTGDCQSNIARGGGWRNDPHELRFSARSKMAHEIRFNMIGFRVARRD